jgi:predicted dinucleotide-binding enzyme
VVKAFNHLMASHLGEHALSAGSDGRRALAVAGDDEDAKATVAGLIDELGFDTVDVGPLAESWRIEPGTPGYGPRLDATELRQALSAAER